MKKRLFIALNLSNETKFKMDQILNCLPNDKNIKKTKIDNLHLTLQFIGDVNEDIIPKTQDTLNKIAAHYKPFYITFGQVGFFPNLQNLRIVWIGINSPKLPHIQLHIRQELKKIITNLDVKSFSPHITLARIKSPLSNIQNIQLQSCYKLNNKQIANKIESIDLMASQLTPQGPIYTLLSQHRLG